MSTPSYSTNEGRRLFKQELDVLFRTFLASQHHQTPQLFCIVKMAATNPNSERTFIAIKPDGVQRGLVTHSFRYSISMADRPRFRVIFLSSSLAYMLDHPTRSKAFLPLYLQVGEVISRFEKKGYKLVAMKFVQISKEHAEKHYIDLASKPFYQGLVAVSVLFLLCNSHQRLKSEL